MEDERRINLRFSAEEFDRLDKKRFEEKTSFQDVGVALFRSWLKGEVSPPSPFGKIGQQEEHVLSAVLNYLRNWPKEDPMRRFLVTVIPTLPPPGKK